jgi:hypothetical protein
VKRRLQFQLDNPRGSQYKHEMEKMHVDDQTNGRLLSLLAHLSLPGKWRWAIGQLKRQGLIGGKAAKSLRAALSDPKYSHRNTGLRLSLVKLLVDDAVASHDYCFLNPDRTMSHLSRRLEAVPDLFSLEKISGATVLDYGCGVMTGLTQAVLLIANGAAKVHAVEPAQKNWPVTHASVLELVKALYGSPAKYNFSGISEADLRGRLALIDFESIAVAASEKGRGNLDFGAIQMHDRLSDVPKHVRFDLALSTSVLEHVTGLEDEMRLQRELLGSSGVAVHAVDFSDHRHADSDYHPFKLYYDGTLHGVNGLRINEVLAAVERAGLRHEVVSKVMAKADLVDRSRLIERFAAFSDADLRTQAATIVLRHAK